MGVTAAFLLGGIQVGQAAFGMHTASKEAEAREHALRLRMQQIESETNAKQIGQMEQLNKVLAAQNARAGMLGEGVKGPVSYNMIQVADFNELHKDFNADELNKVFQQEGVESQIAATEAQKRSAIIGYGIQGAESVGNAIMNSYMLSATPNGSSSKSVNEEATTAGRYALGEI